uniref:Peroxisomal biogenesis factor 11 n=1 Tax=Meloidogyne hapla TaxID=6305 RepID=A0A1I8BDP8_MELHA
MGDQANLQNQTNQLFQNVVGMLDNMKGGHRVYTIERLKFFNTNFDSELKKFFLCNFLISALYRGFLTLSIVVPSRSIQINNQKKRFKRKRRVLHHLYSSVLDFIAHLQDVNELNRLLGFATNSFFMVQAVYNFFSDMSKRSQQIALVRENDDNDDIL